MPLLPSLPTHLLLITITCLLFTTPTTAQKTPTGLQDPTPFRLVESSQQALVDLLSSKLEIVPLQDVLSAATLKTAPIDLDSLNVVKGFRWSSNSSCSGGGSGSKNREDDADAGDSDSLTELWEPRGLTRGEDRLNAETWAMDERGEDHDEHLDEVLVVSWADTSGSSRNPNKGVRISFVNPPKEAGGQVRTYIHVLLVEAVEGGDGDGDGDGDGEERVSFRALRNVDAAGLVWHGNWLYVSDTADVPMRVFDLNNILKVKKGSGIGLVDGGAYEAYNHLYVIPQARAYTFSLPSDVPFNCSTIALYRNFTIDGTVSILAGENKSDDNVRLARWKIDLETSLPLITSESESNPPKRIATAEWAYGITTYGITGFAFRGRNWYIASLNTDGGNLGELGVWRPLMRSDTIDVFPQQLGGIVYRTKGDQILALNKAAGSTRGIWPYSALDLYRQWAEHSIALGYPIDLKGDPDGLLDSMEKPDGSESSTPSTRPTPPASPTSSNATTTGETPQSPTGEQPEDEDSGGVSKGVIAGASVGAVFALLVILAAIFFVWRRKKKQSVNHSEPPHDPPYNPPYNPPELGPWRGTTATTTTTADVTPYRPELEGRQLRAELAGHEADLKSEEKDHKYQ